VDKLCSQHRRDLVGRAKDHKRDPKRLRANKIIQVEHWEVATIRQKNKVASLRCSEKS
jgi:hypothetical protein